MKGNYFRALLVCLEIAEDVAEAIDVEDALRGRECSLIVVALFRTAFLIAMLFALLLAGAAVTLLALLDGLEVVEDASWGRVCDVEAARSRWWRRGVSSPTMALSSSLAYCGIRLLHYLLRC